MSTARPTITRLLLASSSSRRDVLLVGACHLVSAVLTLPIPLFTMALIDAVATSPSWRVLSFLCAMMLVLSLLMVSNRMVEEYVLRRLTSIVGLRGQVRLFGHTLGLSPVDIDDPPKRAYQVGNSYLNLMNAARLAGPDGTHLVGNAAVTAVGVVVLSFIHPRMALWVLAFLPLMVLPLVLANSALGRLGQRELEQRWTTDEKQAAVFVHLDRAKGLGLAGRLSRSALSATFEWLRCMAGMQARLTIFVQGVTIMGGAAAVVILWLAAHELTAGHLTYGGYFAFMFYAGRYLALPRNLAEFLGQLSRTGVEAKESLAWLETPTSIPRAEPPRPFIVGPGALELREVAYRYPGSATPALESVSLAVPAGSRVALVGESGSGKTTILRLLLRHIDPHSGAVLLDGQDLREHRVDDFRRHIGYVGQDLLFQFFSGSIRQNVAMAWGEGGEEPIDDARVEEALRRAHADDFVRALPKGLDARILDMGDGVSRGQLQRLLLARLYYADSRVIILDEFTSNLDAVSEATVLESLARFTEGRTTILVSHRLATVMWADRIVHLAEGRIVSMGTHAELLRADPVYATLFRLQAPLQTDPRALGTTQSVGASTVAGRAP